MTGRIRPAPNQEINWTPTQIRCRACNGPIYKDEDFPQVTTCINDYCENYHTLMSKEGKPT